MRIDFSCAYCDGLSTQAGEGVKQLADIFQVAGAGFVRSQGLGTLNVSFERDLDPARDADAEGSYSSPGKQFTHELLAPSFHGEGVEDPAERKFGPTADLWFFHPYRSIDVCQFYDEKESQKFDDSARRLLQIARLIYPGIRPPYGYLDAEVDSMIAKNSVKKGEIRYLFWANFFGPKFVEQYGRDFLLNAPGWKKEELDDGGILYVATEGISEWIDEWLRKKPPREVMDYFRSRIPKIKVSRPEPRDY
jgi:hypothetical protein